MKIVFYILVIAAMIALWTFTANLLSMKSDIAVTVAILIIAIVNGIGGYFIGKILKQKKS